MKIGQRMTSQGHKNMVEFSEKYAKIDFFAKKDPNIGISPGFLHIKKGNGVSNMFCKFKVHIMKIFFQNGDLNIFRWQPPCPRTLTTYPTPILGAPSNFFHHNDRKRCNREYLDARGHFVLGFGAIGDKPLRGLVTTPPPLRNTRVKVRETLPHE